jgi:hypothetical protein
VNNFWDEKKETEINRGGGGNNSMIRSKSFLYIAILWVPSLEALIFFPMNSHQIGGRINSRALVEDVLQERA